MVRTGNRALRGSGEETEVSERGNGGRFSEKERVR